MKLDRIGLTDKQRLEWVIQVCDDAQERTDADWINLRDEILLFAGIPDYRGIIIGGKVSTLPSRPDYLEEMLEDFRTKIAWAVDGGAPLTSPPSPKKQLHWNDAGPFSEKESWGNLSLQAKVERRLYELIARYGHLVKRCKAPARMKRGRRPKGAPPQKPVGYCDKLFLATKRTQVFGELTCSNRVAAQRKKAQHQKKNQQSKSRKRA